MKPLPRWLGIVSGAGGLLTSLYVAWQTKDWGALIAGVASIAAMFSHSATGSGGVPPAK